MDPAVQAVDGTKIVANAARDRTYDARELERLLARTEGAIRGWRHRTESGDDPPQPPLPLELQQAHALSEHIYTAISRLGEDHRLKRVDLTGEDAHLMKGRLGIQPAYNAQVMVSPPDGVWASRNGILSP